ncbi:MAG: phosphonate ABC transporter, permease protein PhnE [Acidiferrobacterales bacterium]
MTSVSVDPRIAEALALRKRSRLNLLFILLIISGAALWTAWQTGFDIPELIEGTPNIYNLLKRMFPPDFSIVHNLYGPVLETLAMALLGATIPIFFAIPLAWLTATNTSPDPVLGNAIRMLLHTLRTIPELLWAMLLVSAIGLGPFPGTLALVLHNTGSMGKFFYETIEAADPGVIEAMKATGANKFKVIMYGIMPNVLPNMMAVSLLYWEFSSRAATILGLVGAGGIGLTLTHAIQDFSYHEATTCLIAIVLILAVIDRISAYLRKKVI